MRNIRRYMVDDSVLELCGFLARQGGKVGLWGFLVWWIFCL